ncbi:MAG TPA: hypothetical protein VNU66_04195 [Mycobacteriales bacterium]|nr:hypothetical protein [Mycobacteriales bacterium]
MSSRGWNASDADGAGQYTVEGEIAQLSAYARAGNAASSWRRHVVRASVGVVLVLTLSSFFVVLLNTR